MNNVQFAQNYAFSDRSPAPSDSNSIAHGYDSDSDSTASDFFASELQGWEPAGPVTTATEGTSSAEALTRASQPPTDGLLTPDYSSSNSTCTDHTSTLTWTTGITAKSSSSPKAKSKKKRMPVPTDKKDDKYWERRRKNNMAAKRSRELKRQKTLGELNQADRVIQENDRLKAEIGVHKSEIESLRRLLRDANTTLALWIKARQVTEPLNRMPPSLRNCDGLLHFVDFLQ